MKLFFLGLGLWGLFGSVVQADIVKNACLKSKSDRRLCGCIQTAADATLNKSDQNRAAEFILDPEKSQDAKTSNRRRDETFWERYQEFGALAQEFCD